MKTTVGRWSTSSRARPRFRASWMSPGLTSHQQLDAGIAARQHAGRKALKKSKRPFANYFKTEYRLSPLARLPITRTSGVISSFDAVRMMTDPRRSWGTPWDRAGSRVRTRRKRHDVLEPTPTQFGDDSMDRVVERLLEIRFAWDREDGVFCTSLVPESLFGTTKHCRPYLTEVAPSPLRSSISLSPRESAVGDGRGSHSCGLNSSTEDGEVVMITGTPVCIKRRTPLVRRKSGQPKRPHTRSTLGFSGVDTVPSLVLDVSHGPFLTSPSAPLMTLRWKGEHRDAASAQSALQLLRRARAAPTVGLSPRLALLLLKALATVEVEEPALAVSLAIAMGENYNSYSDTECLELLRCLRRLALVRELPAVAAPDIDTSALSSTSAVAGRSPPALYTEAALADALLSHYLDDAAPFLVAKVWSRLPEQSHRLLNRGYFLDWFDLMSLAIAASGPQRLPERLPNAVSEAPYAAKYLFFHYTLGLKEDVLRALVGHLRGFTTLTDSTLQQTKNSNADYPHTLPTASSTSSSGRAAPLHFVDEVKEEVYKPLLLWLCAALLVRIVAESLGDVVRHVGDSLHQHAALAAEQAEAQRTQHEDSLVWEQHRLGDPDSGSDPASTPQGLHQPYPRFNNGAYQQMGCRRPKRVRVRLLPFEAFPRVSQCFSCPFAAVTEKAEAQEHQRRRRHDKSQGFSTSHKGGATARGYDTRAVALSNTGDPSSNAGERRPLKEVESTFASVLANSPFMAKHIERACAALAWSTMVLRLCHAIVRDLPLVPPPPLTLSLPSDNTDGAAAASLRGSAAPLYREGNGDEWAHESAAMEVRQALCYRFVRSSVQQHIDALFAFIPWAEMESAWEPVLTTGVKATEEILVPDATGAAAADNAVSLTAAALEAVLMEDGVGPAQASVSTESAATLSEAEQRARATMEGLRERLEEFQVAVAELLEAHETSFPDAVIPASSSSLGAGEGDDL
ncbi:conserved hypothetical protein [Leishmania mexicana MHOM/GT/2001/U1103]|uniref:Uncharacterized protein n=1 Tax=Leishmania mexicana (strain MHOM/GT/2001/U1103) TaxID=929439 RepID=E9AXL5_LEIMU|nr:conserved hypothetical protein [Leishmania mexicana MHOM/GT/2001/U1103]CBZ27706.1 conserved hypothetical protein [Leishmania mexicana MHOM/GT/2001/U1103]